MAPAICIVTSFPGTWIPPSLRTTESTVALVKRPRSVGRSPGSVCNPSLPTHFAAPSSCDCGAPPMNRGHASSFKISPVASLALRSYGHAQKQRLGNVVFILGGCVSKTSVTTRSCCSLGCGQASRQKTQSRPKCTQEQTDEGWGEQIV